MKSLVTAACLLFTSATVLAEENIIELQKEKVALLKENRTDLRQSFANGAIDAREMESAEVDLVEAQLVLAELEGDTKKVIAMHRELVVRAEETMMYARRQVEKGTASVRELRKAQLRLIERKIAKAKAEKAAQSPAP